MTMAVNIGIMLLNQASGQVTPILLISLVKGAAVFAAVAPFLYLPAATSRSAAGPSDP